MGLSRQPTHDESQPWPLGADKSSRLNGAPTRANGYTHANGQPDRRNDTLRRDDFGKPFTEEELTKAVTNKSLQPTVLT